MNNSGKSFPSSSRHIFQENYEEPMPYGPNPLPDQHPAHPIFPSPTSFNNSFNIPNFMHTPNFPAPMALSFPAPMTTEGARYSMNSDGYIANDTVGLDDMNQTFTEKPFILKIPNGFDVISCVTHFAQRHQLSLTVLCGDGLISEVDFTYSRSAIRPESIFGCFQIISFSGNYNCMNAAPGDIVSSFNVSLVDVQGIFLGGLVASTLKAASTVTLVVCITEDLS